MLLTILLLKQIEHRQELSEIKLPWITSSISQQMCAIVVVMDMCSSFAVVVTGIPCSIESIVLVRCDAFDDCKIGQDRMIGQVVFITIVVS